jgi:hypothetical protein
MKSVATLLAVFVALGLAFAVVYTTKREPTAAPEEAGISFAGAGPDVPLRRPLADEPLAGVADSEVLARLDRLLARMDALESKVGELDVKPRRSLKEEPLPPSRFDDQDLETLRALVREGISARGREVIREEIEAEAWRVRQEELAATARLLGRQLALPVECMDPLVAALCANGRRFFELERLLAAEDHSVDEAARLGREFRSVRVRLSKDLDRVIEDDVLAARIFLYIVSKGDDASLTIADEDALDLRRDWDRTGARSSRASILSPLSAWRAAWAASAAWARGADGSPPKPAAATRRAAPDRRAARTGTGRCARTAPGARARRRSCRRLAAPRSSPRAWGARPRHPGSGSAGRSDASPSRRSRPRCAR